MDRQSAEAFLYREARLLDEGRLDDWLALTTDDVVYWVPNNADDVDPAAHISIVYADAVRLRTRVWRVAESGMNHSQDPPSQTMRSISNVEIDGTEPNGDVRLRCNLLLYEFRPGGARRDAVPNVFAARCRYRLRAAGEEWRSAYKQVSLLTMDGVLPALNYLL